HARPGSMRSSPPKMKALPRAPCSLIASTSSTLRRARSCSTRSPSDGAAGSGRRPLRVKGQRGIAFTLPQRHRGDHAARAGKARLEIDRAEERLERGGEHRFLPPSACLLLPAPEPELAAEPQRLRPSREARARDEGGAARREHADG